MEKIFEKLAQRSESCLGFFFRRASETMKRQENVSLQKILKKEQEQCLKESGLTVREQEQLVRICCILGQADRMTQNVTLEEYQYELHQEGKDAGEQMSICTGVLDSWADCFSRYCCINATLYGGIDER